MNTVFKTPLLLLLIPFVVAGLYWWQRKKRLPAFRFSSALLLEPVAKSWKARLSSHFYFIRIFAVVLLMIALAGPQKILEEASYKAEGIDIVLALDASGSMAAEDFKINGERVNRLVIVKRVVEEFIKKRESDRVGLIAFSQFAYTVCPLTFDKDWLLENLERLELGMIEDGTAIGSAIASGVARLKNSTSKSRIIILLTDGNNNAGKVDPLTAAKMAQALGIRIYTIGAGSKGPVPFPVQDFWGRRVYQNVEINLDDQVLKEIAELTKGKYFLATDTESLRSIYQQIDSLEKVEIKHTGYREYQQLFVFFLVPAMLLLLGEIILLNTVLMKIP